MLKILSSFSRLATFLFVGSLSVQAHSGALNLNLPVEKYQLKNGLTVLFHQDRSAPLVAYHTYFRAGSRDEEEGYTGIAHLFEHMMFKGAKRYKDKDFDKVLRATGANYNAFTTFDMTGYNIDLPSHLLELAIDMESDRLEHLQLNEANLASEREVVKEERRFRIDNSVGGSLFEEIFAGLFTKANYRWLTAGRMADLDRITLEKCKEFFRQYYAPNNAIIVVSGDFDIPQTKSWIERYYGHMQSQTVVRPPSVQEAEQAKATRKVVQRELDAELFAISYLTEPVGSDVGYALDILSDVLGQGTASRLYDRLVRKAQTVDSIVAYHYELKEAGVYIIQGSMKAGSSTAAREQALKAIEGEIFRLRTKLISPRELERAKTRVMKRFVDSLSRVTDRARLLGTAEVYYGDYSKIFRDLEKYQKVTAQEVQKVAERFLKPQRSNTVIMAKKSASSGGAQ